VQFFLALVEGRFYRDFSGKTGASCGGLMVNLWWFVWLMWCLSTTFSSDEEYANYCRFIFASLLVSLVYPLKV